MYEIPRNLGVQERRHGQADSQGNEIPGTPETTPGEIPQKRHTRPHGGRRNRRNGLGRRQPDTDRQQAALHDARGKSETRANIRVLRNDKTHDASQKRINKPILPYFRKHKG